MFLSHTEMRKLTTFVFDEEAAGAFKEATEIVELFEGYTDEQKTIFVTIVAMAAYRHRLEHINDEGPNNFKGFFVTKHDVDFAIGSIAAQVAGKILQKFSQQ